MIAEIPALQVSLDITEGAEQVIVMQDPDLLYVGGGAETGVLF